mmetsp:Transcript_23453/g.73110  ORF Transcript_23453/g.73110 Transcript_23453/m.73110 type:complete len:203 (+) Transcript_23453:596-1204(+)
MLAPISDAHNEQGHGQDRRSKDDAVRGACGCRAPEKHRQCHTTHDESRGSGNDGHLVHPFVLPTSMLIPPVMPRARGVQDDARLHQHEGARDHHGHGREAAEELVGGGQGRGPQDEEAEELPGLVIPSCTQRATAEREHQQQQEDHHRGGHGANSHLVREAYALLPAAPARANAKVAIPHELEPVASGLDPALRRRTDSPCQ